MRERGIVGPMEDVEFRCPYCGEVNVLELEPSGFGEMVQDCWVCCRPIHLRVGRGPSGDPQVSARREDE